MTRKQLRPSSDREDQENRGLPWRIATALAILASLVLIPVAYKILWPADEQRNRGRGSARVIDERAYDASEEETAGPGHERNATPSTGVNRSAITEEGEVASLPDPRGFFDELIQSVWDQTGTTPSGVRLGSTSQKLRETLVKGFARRPSEVDILYLPDAGVSGLCTLKVKDDQGREGVIGVRLIRLKGIDTPWEVESMVVMKPALPPKGRGSSS